MGFSGIDGVNPVVDGSDAASSIPGGLIGGVMSKAAVAHEMSWILGQLQKALGKMREMMADTLVRISDSKATAGLCVQQVSEEQTVGAMNALNSYHDAVQAQSKASFWSNLVCTIVAVVCIAVAIVTQQWELAIVAGVLLALEQTEQMPVITGFLSSQFQALGLSKGASDILAGLTVALIAFAVGAGLAGGRGFLAKRLAEKAAEEAVVECAGTVAGGEVAEVAAGQVADEAVAQGVMAKLGALLEKLTPSFKGLSRPTVVGIGAGVSAGLGAGVVNQVVEQAMFLLDDMGVEDERLKEILKVTLTVVITLVAAFIAMGAMRGAAAGVSAPAGRLGQVVASATRALVVANTLGVVAQVSSEGYLAYVSSKLADATKNQGDAKAALGLLRDIFSRLIRGFDGEIEVVANTNRDLTELLVGGSKKFCGLSRAASQYLNA